MAATAALAQTPFYSGLSGGDDILRRNAGSHSRDISSYGFGSLTPSDNFYSGTYDTRSMTSIPDPIMGNENQQTFTQSLIAGNTRTESLMQTMYPDRKYDAPKVDTQSLKRDPTKKITDGQQVAEKTVGAQAETQEKIGQFKEDFKQAKTEALAQFVDSAKSMGIDPAAAADQMVGDQALGKASAIAYVAAEAAVGGGTLATIGKASFLNNELSKEDKKLSPEQQKALLEDMQKNLQNPSPAQQDAQDGMTASVSAAAGPSESEVAWENMEIDDLAELLEADPEGEDQPEMQELLQMEHDLDEVVDHNQATAEQYGNFVTTDKLFAHAETGNDAISKIVDEASVVVDSEPMAQKFDATAASLAGDSLSGVVLKANDTRFDSNTVETVVDMTQVDTATAAQHLEADVKNQFRAGGLAY